MSGRSRRPRIDGGQLGWVHRNRQTNPGAERIGAVLRQLMTRAPLKVPAWRARIAGALDGVQDEVLAGHTWLGGFRAGVVTLCVDDPALIGALRMQWHRRLVETLSARLPDLGIVDVRFRLADAPRPAAGPEA